MTASRHCLVVGAGVAGAAIARALAERGWQVDVADQASHVAAGASGVPIGVLSCHVSVDDNPLSKLTRQGLQTVSAFARQHLVKGQDWLDCGVLERRLDGHSKKKHWQSALAHPVWDGWVAVPTKTQLEQAGLTQTHAQEQLWQAQGAWIKPLSLIKALLEHPAIHFQGGQALKATDIAGLGYPAVVLALGAHTSAFLQAWPQATGLPPLPLVPVAGQVTWGLHAAGQSAAFPPFAVNGYGGFVNQVPTACGMAWYSGATFHRGHTECTVSTQDHVSNFEKLERLLPDSAKALQHQWQTPDSLNGWTGVRCTSINRMPIAQALYSDKRSAWYAVTALGSRGLTLAMACAERLALKMDLH